MSNFKNDIDEAELKLIPEPIRIARKSKIILNLDFLDIGIFALNLLLWGIIYIPLIITGLNDPSKEIEKWVGICIAIFALLISAILVLEIFDMKIYKFIYKFVSRIFKKNVIKDFKTVQKIERNTFYLKDENKSIQTVFRLLGKDTSFVTNYDFRKIYKSLSFFLKENDEISFLKMDGNVEIDKSIDFLKNLKDPKYPKNINDEIDTNLKILENLNKSTINSMQVKYFLVLNDTKWNDNFKINDVKKAVALCGLTIIEPNSKELQELEKNIYFNNAHVKETWKYLIKTEITNEKNKNL